MTDCPGYLAITINDRLESEELFKYDLLVSCPPHFNLTFALPTLGLRQDKAFDVVFFDAKAEYRVFLNFVWNEGNDFTAATTRTDLYGQLDTNLDHRLQWDAHFQSSSGIYYFAVIAILSLSLTFVCSVVHVSLYFSSRAAVQSKQRKKKQSSVSSYSEAAGLCAPRIAYRSTTTPGFRSLTPRRRFLVLLYVFVRIGFSLLFTFSALSVLLRLCLRRPIDTVVATAASNTYLADHVTGDASDVIERQFEVELRRQAYLVRDIERACSGYVDELSSAVRSWAQERAQGATIGVGSVTGVVQKTFRRTVAVYQRNLRSVWGHQVRSIENQLKPMIKRHQVRVAAILNGAWFQFPQSLFNASLKRAPQEPIDDNGLPDLGLSEPDETPSFREFLHLDDEEEVQLPLKSFIDW